jgi:hypothetical protein
MAVAAVVIVMQLRGGALRLSVSVSVSLLVSRSLALAADGSGGKSSFHVLVEMRSAPVHSLEAENKARMSRSAVLSVKPANRVLAEDSVIGIGCSNALAGCTVESRVAAVVDEQDEVAEEMDESEVMDDDEERNNNA